ncbi:MAG TPA: ATP-binding protein, partial [Terriglobales bacterium]|nr:ATP-binding protein [Terriglobales bacterium]
MSDTQTEQDAELKIGAHVLVQLGSELVTDVEQAILECVKNAYDADSPGCLIEIHTDETGTSAELAPAWKLRRFDQSFETVTVTIADEAGAPLTPMSSVKPDELIQRRLDYTGRVTIEDTGDGLTLDQLNTSWLVVSRSKKRNEAGGKKEKTKKGRTPLGDKGLGRLGSMKLGDILKIETATSPDAPLATAQFRWTDCEAADTVDQIPVFVREIENTERFKGTRVSVLGLRDLEEWRRKDRIHEITRSLAKLISPFEATSTFPVGIRLDGTPYSLVSVTDDVLSRAIAEFKFSWKSDPENPSQSRLVARARFRRKLFASTRTEEHKERTSAVFDKDNGAAFAQFLPTYKRLKGYPELKVSLDGPWFIELEQAISWPTLLSDPDSAIADPGDLTGAFYFFHLDEIGSPLPDATQPGSAAAAGVNVDRKLIKGMAGISILRDGFRVRSQGDWLELSTGMTSGSTYNMRVDNTVGYFALTGEHNYGLTEKSDREGFVENAAYRGFMQIARASKKFANDALENTRRGLDDYYRDLKKHDDAGKPKTVQGSLSQVERGLRAAEEAKLEADRLKAQLTQEIRDLESSSQVTSPARALEAANRAVRAIDAVRERLSDSNQIGADVSRIRQELRDRSDQAIALFESAAVGLSARGLAHELRTHLTEIRHRTGAIERSADGGAVLPHLRAIRSSCSAISNAASLIDPML